MIWSIARYLEGSTVTTISSVSSPISSNSIFAMCSTSFSFTSLASLAGRRNFNRICARAIGKSSYCYKLFTLFNLKHSWGELTFWINSLITWRACDFALFAGLTEKWISFMAFCTNPTVNGRWVSGFTHFSATMVAMSLNKVSNSFSRSSPETWISPLSSI